MTIGALSATPLAWQAQATQSRNQPAPPPPGITDNGTGQTVSFSANPAFFQAGMSSATMGGLLSAQGGTGFTPPSFSDIDSDGDGSLTQAEFQSFGATVHGDSDTTRADELFGKMDSDGDGTVTSAEKDSFDAGMQTHGPGGPASTIAPETTSGDDATPAETLASLMQELLTALDAYRSGVMATESAATATTSVAA